MKILLISGNYPPKICGIGDYTHRLSEQFNKLGHSTDILSSGNSKYKVSSWSHPLLIQELNKIPWSSYDIIHLQYEGYSFQQSLVLPLYLKFKKIKFYITFHEVFFKNITQKWKNKFLFNHSSGAVVNDQLCLDKLKALTNRSTIPVLKIGVGSNLPIISNPSQKTDTFYIGFFGFLNRVKRADLLVKALVSLKSKTSKTVKLRFIGSFDFKSQDWLELDGIIKANNLETDVEIFNNVSATEASKLISECSVMVLPFSDGASPRRGSLQACLALGKAIISTAPTIKDPDLDFSSFITLSEISEGSLNTNLLELVNNESLRHELESRAKKASLGFSWERIADQHLNFYKT